MENTNQLTNEENEELSENLEESQGENFSSIRSWCLNGKFEDKTDLFEGQESLLKNEIERRKLGSTKDFSDLEEVSELEDSLAKIHRLNVLTESIKKEIESPSEKKTKKDHFYREKIFNLFNSYFNITSMSNRTMELAFGSIVNGIILFLITTILKPFSYIWKKLVSFLKSEKKK